MSLFIGRLHGSIEKEELEKHFSAYGPMRRCDVKKNQKGDLNFGFIEFEDKKDAEDAIRESEGKELHGVRIVVEFAKGEKKTDSCFKCGKSGHWAKDCRGGDRDDRRDDYRRSDDRRRYSRSPPRRRRSYSRDRSERRRRSSREDDRGYRRSSRRDDSRDRHDRGSRDYDRSDRRRNDSDRHYDRGVERRGGARDRSVERQVDRQVERHDAKDSARQERRSASPQKTHTETEPKDFQNDSWGAPGAELGSKESSEGW